MASRGSIKGFYRQRKKNTPIAGGVAKPSAASSKKQVTGALKVPAAAQQIHGSIDVGGSKEAALRQFDMDMRYGPCLGMSRLERWRRASRLGLHPPQEVEDLLLRRQDAGAVNLECLLDGRI